MNPRIIVPSIGAIVGLIASPFVAMATGSEGNAPPPPVTASSSASPGKLAAKPLPDRVDGLEDQADAAEGRVGDIEKGDGWTVVAPEASVSTSPKATPSKAATSATPDPSVAPSKPDGENKPAPAAEPTRDKPAPTRDGAAPAPSKARDVPSPTAEPTRDKPKPAAERTPDKPKPAAPVTPDATKTSAPSPAVTPTPAATTSKAPKPAAPETTASPPAAPPAPAVTTAPPAPSTAATAPDDAALEGRVSTLEQRADALDERVDNLGRKLAGVQQPAPDATATESEPAPDKSEPAPDTTAKGSEPAPDATATESEPAPDATATESEPAPDATATLPGTSPTPSPTESTATPDPTATSAAKPDGEKSAEAEPEADRSETEKPEPSSPTTSGTLTADPVTPWNAKPDAKDDKSEPAPNPSEPSGSAKPDGEQSDPPKGDDKPAAPAAPAPVPGKPAAAKAGEVIFPKTGKPSDPGTKRVISPNPSPLIPAAKLNGPKIAVKPGDDLAAIFDKPLAAGTVVELPRGAVFTKPIVITGKGTKDQPVLVTAGPGTGDLPTFAPAEVGNKDAATVTTRGEFVQLEKLRIAGGSPKLGFDMGATKGGADRIETDGAVNGVWIRDGEQGGTGEGSWVWNSLFENGRMQVGMDGPEDDYGAAAISIQANNVTAEGITGRNLISQPPGTPGDSPDYNKFGGDGALFEGWRKVDNFRGAHSAVKVSPRVFEAGGLDGDGESHAVISGVYADEITDAPFHVQEGGGGPYGGLKTTYDEVDNNISVAKDKSKYGF